MNYETFLQTKKTLAPTVGGEFKPKIAPTAMKDFQRDLTKWAMKKGRAAIFADTGLGKTLMQLVWAEQAAKRVLILAPLAVATQTVIEAEKWGIKATYARKQSEAPQAGITITNYEMLEHFELDKFLAVVLDESSILKNFEGKTRTRLIEACKVIPLRLCCTATPAPNDISEIANHAEFLGIMSRAEMLATFFVHDDNGWRLKKHAKEPFYAWLASWGMCVKYPSDLGYSDDGYILPSLNIQPTFINTDYRQNGMLFAVKIRGIQERAEIRKATFQARVDAAVELVKANPNEQWLLWCGLNDESNALAKALPDAVNVQGSDTVAKKESSLLGFAAGEIKTLITKPKIAGMGMNFQACHQMAFVGLGDSYESYYQSIRRCWRFGQVNEVNVHIVLTEGEYPIYENVLRKEREATEVQKRLVAHVTQYEKEELASIATRTTYAPTQQIQLPNWIGGSYAGC